MDENFDVPITNSFQVEQKESIKLIRNTKGYTYEVKILSIDIKHLKEITDELERVYKIGDIK